MTALAEIGSEANAVGERSRRRLGPGVLTETSTKTEQSVREVAGEAQGGGQSLAASDHVQAYGELRTGWPAAGLGFGFGRVLTSLSKELVLKGSGDRCRKLAVIGRPARVPWGQPSTAMPRKDTKDLVDTGGGGAPGFRGRVGPARAADKSGTRSVPWVRTSQSLACG